MPRPLLLVVAALAVAVRLGAHTPAPAADLEAETAVAEATGNLQEAFELYMRAWQTQRSGDTTPAGARVGERIAALAARLPSPPTVPEAAKRHLTRGLVLFKDAADRAGFERAEAELSQAVRAAPWHGPALYNLAIVEEKLERYASAVRHLKLYSLTRPDDARRLEQVTTKIYELELRAEQASRRLSEVAAMRAGEEHITGPIAESRQSCLGGNRRACGALGSYYYGGIAIAKDLTRAARLFEIACETGDANSCQSLARQLEKGDGVPRDVVRAVRLYQQGCDAGVLTSCVDLAVSMKDGRAITRDTLAAVGLMERACEGGQAVGCVVLGLWVQEGLEGVTRNAARAVRLFEKGCDQGFAEGCRHAAEAYEAGIGVPSDRPRALALFARACAEKVWYACRGAAMVLARGNGVSRDKGRAAEFARQAIPNLQAGCDGGRAKDCSMLASMYAWGDGVDKDKSMGHSLYQRACDLGHEQSCQWAQR